MRIALIAGARGRRAAHKLVWLAAAAVICASPSASLAQDASGDAAKTRGVRLYLQGFGRCIVDYGAGPRAREFVLNQLDQRENWHRAHELIPWECPVSALGGSDAWKHVRGADFLFVVAPALVRWDRLLSRKLDFSAVPPLSHMAPGGDPVDHHIVWLSQFGECVSRAAPEGVQALLRTRVASPAEDAAFSALSPAFGSCLADGKVPLDRDQLRGVLALNFYRLASASRPKSIKQPKAGR